MLKGGGVADGREVSPVDLRHVRRESAHPAQPAVVVGSLSAHELCDFPVRQDQKRPASNPFTTSSATCSGSSAESSRNERRVPSTSARRSMSVRTPCGQSAETVIPRSPYVIDSHSANASDACLVTA